MQQRILIIGLLLWFSQCLSAQKEVETTIATFEQSLQGVSTEDSIQLLKTFVIDYGGSPLYRDYSPGICHKLIRMGKAAGNLKVQEYGTNSLSFAYSTALEFDSMVYYARASMQLAQAIGVDSFHASALQLMTNCHLVLQQYDSAMYYATQAVSYYEKETVKLPISQANTYRMMGQIIARSNREDSGITDPLYYSRKAIEVCSDELDPYYHSKFMLDLAVQFGLQNQNDSVYRYVQMTLERGRRYGHPDVTAMSLHLLTEYYFYTDRYEEALRWIDTVKQQHAAYLSTGQLQGSRFTESEALYHLGRYEEALAVAEALMVDAKAYDTGFVVQDLSSYMSKLYAERGRYKEALDMLQQHLDYTKRIFNEKQSKTVTTLEKKYALAEKEKALAEARQAQVKQALVFQQRGSIALVVFLLSILAGAYFIWRNRLQKLRAEKEASDLQQRLLRSQMNPHFAFNTLGSIQNYLLQSGESNKAAYYLAKFAKLMRQILDQSRASQIPLEEELETLRNYLSLQQLRYENKFTFNLEIDPALAPDLTLIPPMLIQPLIENAIEHGKVHTLADGKVSIEIHPEGKILLVRVFDNGLGKKALKTPRPKSKPESVATSIIQERLAILRERYGALIGFHITYPENGGTEVSLHLPYIQKNL